MYLLYYEVAVNFNVFAIVIKTYMNYISLVFLVQG